MSGHKPEHADARATAEVAPAPAAPEVAQAPAPAFTPLAGLARAVEGVQDDVMGGQAVPDAVSTAIRRRHGRGKPLARSVAGDLGDRLGTDFSGVRVHADAEADTIARSVQAKAFTLGSEIYFSKGTYAPDSSSGRSLLAHELTHVRQHQQGGGSSGGGLSVGTVHDPAEKEAEEVARQVERGGRVAGGSGAAPGGRVRRSPSAGGTIRRVFGVAGVAGVGQARQGEYKVDDEEVPIAFIELADTIKQVEQIPQAVAGGASGMDVWEKTNTFMGTSAGTGTAAALGGLGAIKQTFVAGQQMKEGFDYRAEGKETGDSLSKNLGETKIESGAWGLLSGATGGGNAIQNAMKSAAAQAPLVDVATNSVDAVSKGKKAIEDGTAAYKLGNQKVKAKREADSEMPYEVRCQRFGKFLQDLKADKFFGPLKGDDKKRWPKVKQGWFARPTAATDGFATDETDTTTFNPLTTDWGQPTVDDAGKKAFLAFVKTQGKDFGKGTEFRDAYDTKVKNGTVEQGQEATEDYDDLRNMKKMGKFGQVRKADTAAVNAVESVAAGAEVVGTFTAAGDMGATKLTGKILKALSGLYKGVKSLVKRARRVHKLAVAKNTMNYGNESNRGFIWGMQQFFAGNISAQQENSRTMLEDAIKKDKAYRLALATAQTDLASYTQDMAKYDQYMSDKATWDADKTAHDDAMADYVTDKADYDAAKLDHEERRKTYDQVWAAYRKKLQEIRDDKTAFMAQPSVKQRPAIAEHLYQQSRPQAPQRPTEANPGRFKMEEPTAPTLRDEPTAVTQRTTAPQAPPMLPETKATRRGGKEKSVNIYGPSGDLDPAKNKALMKLLTIQCDRKIQHMLNALASRNPTVKHRAYSIMHIIAETNLAGKLEKIQDADLDRFGELFQKEKASTLTDPTEVTELARKRKAITEIIKHQLSGIGG